MQQTTQSTPGDGSESVSESGLEDVAEAFRLGSEIYRGKYVDTAAALQRISDRLDNAHEYERRAYANGYADALDGREPQFEVTR